MGISQESSDSGEADGVRDGLERDVLVVEVGRHGPVDMRRAIAKSCNTYFYAMGHRIGYDKIAPMAKLLGLGAKFDLPVVSQNYGTVPDSDWKARKYKESRRIVERPDWTASDTLNASIGQGFLIVNPLQLAVMAARIASGRDVDPRLVGVGKKPGPLLDIPAEHLEAVRGGMWEVVNGDGTAGASRLPFPDIQMAGKTGTAQVRNYDKGGSRGKGGTWSLRDHGLFVAFAPIDEPRYAIAVVVQHAGLVDHRQMQRWLESAPPPPVDARTLRPVIIGLDGDDTLWHSEGYYRAAQAAFEATGETEFAYGVAYRIDTLKKKNLPEPTSTKDMPATSRRRPPSGEPMRSSLSSQPASTARPSGNMRSSKGTPSRSFSVTTSVTRNVP